MHSLAIIISGHTIFAAILVLIVIFALAAYEVLLERGKSRRSEAELRIASTKLEERFEKHVEELTRTTGKWKVEVEKRRKAEQDKRRQYEWWRVTLSSIGDAVITADQEGSINYLNPKAEQLTGWMNKDAVGKPLTEVFRII